jgi:hypothetical protein
MTDYEYILQQARKSHYSRWDDAELRKCVDMLTGLSRQELTFFYYSRWVKEDKVFRESVFNTLFKDKVGKREEHIKNADIDELIEEFQDKKSGNVSLIRKEMRERYKAGKDRQKIAMAFNSATKSDQSWLKWQIRKERYSNSGNNNNQWKKSSW